MFRRKSSESLREKIGIDNAFLLFNGLAILIIVSFGIFAKGGRSLFKRIRVVYRLFDEAEPIFDQPYLGLLTHVSEIVLCLAAAFCLFSFYLVSQVRPGSQRSYFLLFSAIFLSIFMADDLFRLTLILQVSFGIPKAFMYCLYGAGLATYFYKFWRIIALTRYPLLLIASFLLIVSGVADLVHGDGEGISAMLWGILEDSTKLIGIISIALYFWHVCQTEVLAAFAIEKQP